MRAQPPYENTKPTTPPHRRFYAFTDNGDWMEMVPRPGERPLEADGVSFLALDAVDDDELYVRADDGEGILLGRVTIVDGLPVLHLADDLVADLGTGLAAALDISGDGPGERPVRSADAGSSFPDASPTDRG